MPASDLSYTPQFSITLNSAGIYKIDLQLLGALNAATTLSCAVRRNEANILGSVVKYVFAADEAIALSSSVIETLAAGDVIDLVMESLDETYFLAHLSPKASLVIVRLA